MGSGRWSPDAWTSYATSSGYDTKSVGEIYAQTGMHPSLTPFNVNRRESCDSADNPASTAIIVGLDVTGSMAPVLDAVARQGLNTLVTEIYNRKPVTDPHVMCMAIGDVECDRAPLQITQFEADIRIAQQLELLYLESGGGGNTHESYTLAWHWAANHTQIDCWDKRQRKGYLFTIGDECPTPLLRRADITNVLGYTPDTDQTAAQLLNAVSERWDVFHVMLAQGNYALRNRDRVRNEWTAMLGQQAIWLEDYHQLAQVVVSAMQIREGEDPKAVAASWSGATAGVVAAATAHIRPRGINLAGVV